MGQKWAAKFHSLWQVGLSQKLLVRTAEDWSMILIDYIYYHIIYDIDNDMFMDNGKQNMFKVFLYREWLK